MRGKKQTKHSVKKEKKKAFPLCRPSCSALWEQQTEWAALILCDTEGALEDHYAGPKTATTGNHDTETVGRIREHVGRGRDEKFRGGALLFRDNVSSCRVFHIVNWKSKHFFFSMMGHVLVHQLNARILIKNNPLEK